MKCTCVECERDGLLVRRAQRLEAVLRAVNQVAIAALVALRELRVELYGPEPEHDERPAN